MQTKRLVKILTERFGYEPLGSAKWLPSAAKIEATDVSTAVQSDVEGRTVQMMVGRGRKMGYLANLLVLGDPDCTQTSLYRWIPESPTQSAHWSYDGRSSRLGMERLLKRATEMSLNLYPWGRTEKRSPGWVQIDLSYSGAPTKMVPNSVRIEVRSSHKPDGEDKGISFFDDYETVRLYSGEKEKLAEIVPMIEALIRVDDVDRDKSREMFDIIAWATEYDIKEREQSGDTDNAFSKIVQEIGNRVPVESEVLQFITYGS